MGNAFFVVWRESLEAFLIVGILFAWLKANDGGGSRRRGLFVGIGAGLGLALLLGWALLTVQDELSGQALDLFQTATLIVAAWLITHMVLWMRSHGRQLKSQLHAGLSTATKRSGVFGVATVAALAIAREGAETVIFLYGLAQGSDAGVLIAGALAGFAAAAVTAWLTTKSLARLHLGVMLRISAWLLLLLASALLVAGVDRLIGAGWLPPLLDPVWDSSALLDDASVGGRLLADISGYRPRPALTTLLAWGSYWLLVILAYRKAGRD